MVIVRYVVALDAQSGWCLFQMDVYNAFLQGDLFEEVYMSLLQDLAAKGRTKCVDCSNLYMI